MIPQPPLQFGPKGEVWPSGRSKVLAMLEVTDAWVASLVDVPLLSDFEDGLGPWVGTGGRLPSGAMVELVRYTLPGPNLFQLRCDWDGDLRQVLAEFTNVTNLDSAAVTWRHSEIADGDASSHARPGSGG